MTQFQYGQSVTSDPMIPPFQVPSPAPLPPTPLTADQETSAAINAEKTGPNLWTALTQGTILNDIADFGVRKWMGGETEPGWRQKHDIKTLFEGVAPQFHDDLLSEASYLDALHVKDSIAMKMAAADKVAQYGAAGAFAQFGMGIVEFAPLMAVPGSGAAMAFMAGGTDAVSVSNAARVALASGRAAEAAKIASRIGVLRRLAYGGIAGSAQGVAFTAVDGVFNPTVEGEDVLHAAYWGAGLGGGVNAFFGKGIMRDYMVKHALKYEKQLQAAGKELAVRFNADNVLEQVAQRFGIAEADAKNIIVGARLLENPVAGTGLEVAIAGPKARLRRGQVVMEETIITDAAGVEKAKVQHLNDGKIVIRALTESKSGDSFVRSMAETLRARIFTEENGLLSNREVLIMDAFTRGDLPAISRLVPVTETVEAGIGPHPKDMRLGLNLTDSERQTVTQSPALAGARRDLGRARSLLQQAIEKFQNVMDDASAMLTEAETEEALAAHELAMSNTPEYKAVLKASARAKDAAKKVAELEVPETTANIKRIIEARRAVLEKLQAQQKATRGFQKTERIATATLNEAEDMVRKAKEAIDSKGPETQNTPSTVDVVGPKGERLQWVRASDPGQQELVYLLKSGKDTVGSFQFIWDSKNRAFRPQATLGVNIRKQYQGQGFYGKLLKELSKHVDLGSTSTSEALGTQVNAVKVWKKLGASTEKLKGKNKFVDSAGNVEAFFLRRTSSLQNELAAAEQVLSEFRSRELVQQLGQAAHEKRQAYGLARKELQDLNTAVAESKRLKRRISADIKKSLQEAADKEAKAADELAQAEEALIKADRVAKEDAYAAARKLANSIEEDAASSAQNAKNSVADAEAALADAEMALAMADPEFMIKKRTAPLSNEEKTRFQDAFINWLTKNEIPAEVPVNARAEFQSAMQKLKETLMRVYADATDPRIGDVPVSPEVDLFFREIFIKHSEMKAKTVMAAEQTSMYARIAAIASGAAVPEKPAKAEVTPKSLDSDWKDNNRADIRLLGFDITRAPGMRFLNQALASINSKIGAAQWLGERMMWSRIGLIDPNGKMVPQRATISELWTRIRNPMEHRLKRAFDKGYNEYTTGKEFTKINPAERTKNAFQHKAKEKFSIEVYNEILKPGSSESAAVKATAKAFAEHFDRMRKIALETELPGFSALDTSVGYFPRMWKWQLLDDFLANKQSVADLTKLIKKSMTIEIVESADDPRIAQGLALTEDGAWALANYTAERLRSLARGEQKNAYLDMDEIMLAVLREHVPPPRSSAGVKGTPHGNRRIPMDVTIKVKLDDGRIVSLSDFVSNDVVHATETYNRSVFGAIAEKQLVEEFRDQLIARGKMTAEEAGKKITKWNDVITYVKSSAEEGRYVTSKEVERTVASLEELYALLRHSPMPSILGEVFSPMAGRLMKLGYLQNGQAFGLAQFLEVSRIIGRTSAASVMKQMPIVQELAQAARRGEIPKEQFPLLHWIDQALGTGGDRLRRTTLSMIDSRLEKYSTTTQQGWWRKAENWFRNWVDPNLNEAATVFSDVTGLAPLTTATQHLIATSIIQEMYDGALLGKAIYSDALLAQWGVTRAEFEIMVSSLRKTAKVNKVGRVIDFDHALWDQNIYGRFLDFMERGVVSTIQDPPTRGDFAKPLWNDLGRLFLQFRSFNIKGINNFLLTSVQRRDARLAVEYSVSMGLGLLTQMARKAIYAPTYKDEKDQQKYWETSFSPQALTGMALSGPTENWLFLATLDPIAQFTTGSPMFSQSVRYSDRGGSVLDVSATPAAGVIKSVYDSVSAPVQSLLMEDRQYTQSDLNNVTSMIIGRKFMGLNQGFNYIEKWLGSGLPKEKKPKD